LNPRLRPWQGRTLPLSYSRSLFHSTALAYLLTIHCARMGTRSSSLGSPTAATVSPLGRKRSMNWGPGRLLALGLLCTWCNRRVHMRPAKHAFCNYRVVSVFEEQNAVVAPEKWLKRAVSISGLIQPRRFFTGCRILFIQQQPPSITGATG
jgi:hypothetical protein